MHWLSNSWNNSDNLPFKQPCSLYKPLHSCGSISIAYSFQIAVIWTFLSSFWGLGWFGVFLWFFVMFSLKWSCKAAFAINILTSLFLLFINTHHIFPNAFIIHNFSLNYFFRKLFPDGSWCYSKKIGVAITGDMKYISICLHTIQHYIRFQFCRNLTEIADKQ